MSAAIRGRRGLVRAAAASVVAVVGLVTVTALPAAANPTSVTNLMVTTETPVASDPTVFTVSFTTTSPMTGPGNSDIVLDFPATSGLSPVITGGSFTVPTGDPPAVFPTDASSITQSPVYELTITSSAPASVPADTDITLQISVGINPTNTSAVSVWTSADTVPATFMLDVTPRPTCHPFQNGDFVGLWQTTNLPQIGAGANDSGGAQVSLAFVTPPPPTISYITSNIEMLGNVPQTLLAPGASEPFSYIGCQQFGILFVNTANTFAVWVLGTENADGDFVGTFYDTQTVEGTFDYGPVQPGSATTNSSPSTTLQSSDAGLQTEVSEPTSQAADTMEIDESACTSCAASDFFGTGGQSFDSLTAFAQVSAPTGTPTAPITLTFTLNASVLPPTFDGSVDDYPAMANPNGTTTPGPADIVVFHDGGEVPQWCAEPADPSGVVLSASTPSCEDNAVWNGSQLTITVKTISASIWGFGVMPASSTSNPGGPPPSSRCSFFTASKDTVVVGQPFSFLLRTYACYPWPTLTGVGMPTWLTVTDGHDGFGSLSGTAPLPGHYTFTITASNSAGITSQKFKLVVKKASRHETASI